MVRDSKHKSVYYFYVEALIEWNMIKNTVGAVICSKVHEFQKDQNILM
jgi:hypothetical protein